MKTIRVSVETRKAGSRCEAEFQIYDAATDDEIHEACQEEVRKMADWGWTVVEKRHAS